MIARNRGPVQQFQHLNQHTLLKVSNCYTPHQAGVRNDASERRTRQVRVMQTRAQTPVSVPSPKDSRNVEELESFPELT